MFVPFVAACLVTYALGRPAPDVNVLDKDQPKSSFYAYIKAILTVYDDPEKQARLLDELFQHQEHKHEKALEIHTNARTEAEQENTNLKKQAKDLLEFKWLSIARSHIKEFENEFYMPTPQQRKEDIAEFENKLKAMKNSYNRDTITQLYHEIKFKRILKLTEEPEIGELKKGIKEKSFTDETFASLMGQAYLHLSRRVCVSTQPGHKGPQIVFNVSDGVRLNQAMSIFLSLYIPLDSQYHK